MLLDIPGIYRDKTMDDKLMYLHPPLCCTKSEKIKRFNSWDTQLNETTNQNSIPHYGTQNQKKIKWFKPWDTQLNESTNQNSISKRVRTRYYKTLGTSEKNAD